MYVVLSRGNASGGRGGGVKALRLRGDLMEGKKMNATQRDWDITTIEAENKRAGLHFFDASARRFFNSRILEDVYQGPGGVYFVTSERFAVQTPRRYTVRQFHPDTGRVETLKDFNIMSRYQAIKGAKQAAQGRDQ